MLHYVMSCHAMSHAVEVHNLGWLSCPVRPLYCFVSFTVLTLCFFLPVSCFAVLAMHAPANSFEKCVIRFEGSAKVQHNQDLEDSVATPLRPKVNFKTKAPEVLVVSSSLLFDV